MLGWLKRTLTITLNVDWLYRRLGDRLGRIDRVTGNTWQWLVASVGLGAKRLNDRLQRHAAQEGIFGRTWPTGTMAFWTTVMLALYLILSNL